MTRFKKLHILGIRGIPAKHGGFETFAEKLALYLTKHGWQVFVYCQTHPREDIQSEAWQGIKLVNIPVRLKGALGTVEFDWKSIQKALKEDGLFLTLGYNTAVFNTFFRIRGKVNIINMDGIEWQRDKWGGLAKTWLRVNEWIGVRVGNFLVADHPRIKEHLSAPSNEGKIAMIPYGAEEITDANKDLLIPLGIRPWNYSLVIARPEPENSVLEIVKGFSSSTRNHKLVVLGDLLTDSNCYHREIKNFSSDEVIFPGAIYDKPTVQSLRFYSRFYIHGHRVGGTNPSLVESLGAGAAVIAHNNAFNRWVSGIETAYFNNEKDLAELLDRLLYDKTMIDRMKASSRQRFNQGFTWDHILRQYDDLLEMSYPK